MSLLPALPRVDGPALVRTLAILAFTVGLGVWAAVLFAPAPRALPPALSPAATAGLDTSGVARWFGGGMLRVRVAVMGLITAEHRGAALISINGGPAQSYKVGQTLAPGVTLTKVSPTDVSIDQDGAVEQVAVPVNPATVVQGFLPVTKPQAAAAKP